MHKRNFQHFFQTPMVFEMKKDMKEMLSSELISVTGGLIAGFMLASATNQLELIPGILILLPGFLEMRGNISGALSARLSAGMFLGKLKPKFENSRILKSNILACFAQVLIVSFVLGIVSFLSVDIFFGISNMKIVYIAILAGILSNLIEIPLTTIATFWLFRHGHDPNNIMGPYVTTTGDLVSIVSLLIAIVII